MRLPAIIHHRKKSASCPVAALTVLDRLAVALHRAGCADISILPEESQPLPNLQRSRALGIEVKVASKPPRGDGPVLYAESHVLAQAGDVRRVLQEKGRLSDRSGCPLPLGVTPVSRSAWPPSLDHLPRVRAEGVAWTVNDSAQASQATKALWSSLQSSADGLIDKWFNRPVGRWLSKVLIHTSVSPNQMSILATLVGLCSAWLFALGQPRAALWGALLLQLSAIIDCVDGDLARVLFKESPLGKWLDIVGDQVVHIAVFAAIGVGLWRAGTDAPVLAMAGSAALGVVISFLVVLRGLRQPLGQNSRLQKLIDATTNRDFSVLLLALVVAGRLEWFLWLTAIGVHVFWVIAWVVQIRDGANPASWKTHGENRA